MTSFVDFYTSVPIENLPAPFRNAIINSNNRVSDFNDDAIVGSIRAGSGYCALDAYKRELYCACVNAPVPNPECIFTSCANYSNAYKTFAMNQALQNSQQNCPSYVSCNQILNMGGESNVASGIDQSFNCNSTIESFFSFFKTHPLEGVAGGVLCIAIILLFLSFNNDMSEAAPPPATRRIHDKRGKFASDAKIILSHGAANNDQFASDAKILLSHDITPANDDRAIAFAVDAKRKLLVNNNKPAAFASDARKFLAAKRGLVASI